MLLTPSAKPGAPTRVLVTGAGGQTGSIVVRKLLECGEAVFQTRALVRSEESEAKLREKLGQDAKALEVVHGDVTQKPPADAFAGCKALVIVTSAMPRLDKLSLVGVILTKVFTLGFVSRKPSFYFDEGQSPAEVDFEGQKKQIEAAKAAGVEHIVLVSSMAGTKPDHFLNTQMDNIVLWKRKAECFLMSSGVPYTIIHPGGLLPHFGDKNPAPGGVRPLVVGVDDSFLGDSSKSLVPREDVGEVCVQCLLEPEARGRSFDLGSFVQEEGKEPAKGSIKELLSTLEGKSCAYSAADADFSGSVASRL